ncbi:hypothetical protein [Hyphomonas johnsonii]|uniref:hypothetical protein n=1 Tax=Hyphomonas johnsonii TaxID=81031 RepID=UPI0012EB063B|nr:hypothetical protein [Hyphomonas johnsonii]
MSALLGFAAGDIVALILGYADGLTDRPALLIGAVFSAAFVGLTLMKFLTDLLFKR